MDEYIEREALIGDLTAAIAAWGRLLDKPSLGM